MNDVTVRKTTSVAYLYGVATLLCGALVGCANLSTLQTAHPLAEGTRETSIQSWMLPNRAFNDARVYPAFSDRQGYGSSDLGIRVTFPGSLQFDGKGSVVRGRAALSIGMGVGLDAVSLAGILIAGLAESDEEDESSSESDDHVLPLTFELFMPIIASYQVVADVLSLHATVRPQLWTVFPSDDEERKTQLYVVGAIGARVGNDVGLHVEAAPYVGTTDGLAYTAAASVFWRWHDEAPRPTASP